VLYLIDGYNLLFALGVLVRGQPAALAKARRRLLDLLHEAHAGGPDALTVVFDARHPPPGLPREYDEEGIHVTFAAGDAAADDLIEELVRRAPVPERLTVVSNDHRVREAARRRNCGVQGCAEFLDALEARRRPAGPPHDPPAKPDGASGAETDRWLRAFADLDNDPAMKELFDIPWSDGEPPE